MTSYRSVRVAECLVFVLSDYEVPALSPARGGTAHDYSPSLHRAIHYYPSVVSI